VSAAETSRCRAELVRILKEAGRIRTSRVADAFGSVPRDVFLPDLPIAEAYADRAHAVKIQDGVTISSSSQPAIMAEMLELLAPEPGSSVLEIGAGTGYNAALLARLVGPDGFVSSVDLDFDIVERARANLAAAGYPSVHVFCADGAAGDAKNAPFDGLIATVGIGDIPAPWVEQLRLGGRLVAPLSLGLAQRVVAFERNAEFLRSTSVIGGEFMAFRGPSAAASIGTVSTLGDPAIRLRTFSGNAIDTRAIAEALRGGSIEVVPAARLSIGDVWESLDLWLSLHEPAFCRLTAQGDAARKGFVPDSSGMCAAASRALAATLGVCEGSGITVFALTADGIRLRAFGDAATCTARLNQAIERWNRRGRPCNEELEIISVRRDAARVAPVSLPMAGAASVIRQASSDLYVRWTR
jgi:protein-L-isoaspartate(D-aspartate) O-methyltransferase